MNWIIRGLRFLAEQWHVKDYEFWWGRHENMFPCIGSRVNTKYELFHVLDASGEPRAPQSEATLPPTTLASIPTTWPWPIRQKLDGY